jgi:hypothetical protein
VIRDIIVFIFPMLEAKGHIFWAGTVSILPFFIITLIPVIWIKSNYLKQKLSSISLRKISLLVSLSHTTCVLINSFLIGLLAVCIFKILPNQPPYDCEKFTSLSVWLYYAVIPHSSALVFCGDYMHLWWRGLVDAILYMIPCFFLSYWGELFATRAYLKLLNIDQRVMKNAVWQANILSYMFILLFLIGFFIFGLFSHH